MATNLVKFTSKAKSGDKDLHWNRVVTEQDAYPFRGQPQALREEEYEARVTKVADFRNAFFNLGVEEQNQAFRDVMECIANGWFHLIHLERFWVDPQGNRTTCHYVEWIEYYLEDGSRVQANQPTQEAYNV